MHAEGSVRIDSRRHARLAFLRQKQWWSFERLDPERKLYFVLLALKGLPTSYVSLKAIDYEHDVRWEEDHLGSFHAAPGDAVNVTAEGKWGHLRFQGQADSGWQIEAQTPNLQLQCEQRCQAPVHTNRFLTRHIDYTITQFPMNTAQGNMQLKGQAIPFQGYGYCEHNWGVQPRHSCANWLHFWTPDTAGIVLDCHYDAGVPHHYTYLWHGGQWQYLFSPAQFFFVPEKIGQPWQIKSPDLDLIATPVYYHHTRMRMPPFFSYIDIDYYESLVNVEGKVTTKGNEIAIKGIGKFDHNFNLW
ncbi:MAG: DUF2804 family protein [Chloroflexi bacterium]|nr:DUF2804 family protein [Chloroflexota bacterium]